MMRVSELVFVFSVLLGCWSARSQVSAAEEYLPGGEKTADAVATRAGKTALSKLAAEMKPGTWSELGTKMPENLWRSPEVDGGRNNGGAGGLHIAGWTDDAHWDSRTGQFLYMGLRQTRQFIAYSEESNSWRVIDLDRKGGNPVFRTRFGHIYGTNGFDHERSRFYHRYGGFEDLEGGISYFDTVKEKWTKLPPQPGDSGGMCVEYFNALDGLLALSRKERKAYVFRDVEQKWSELASVPIDGYHSLFRHNPLREEVLMAGGNQNLRVVARLTKDGRVERLRDAPVDLSVRSDKVTVDPLSGRYLIVKSAEKGEKPRCFEFDSQENKYREIDGFGAGWPFGHYAMPVVAFIPEYGVTMWAERKVYLYKHASDKTEG